MTRINALRTETRSLAWGSRVKTWGTNAGALTFAAVLIICSLTVGCSKDKPKIVSANNAVPTPAVSQPDPAPLPVAQPETKPVTHKVQRRKPATVNYADKTYGVSFEYPRRYAIETGNAATDMLASNPLPMNFVQPGGIALAAVELPETGYANTDFSSAFFNVSVHKTLTADQCNEFAVPQPKVASAAPVTATESASAQATEQAGSQTPVSSTNSSVSTDSGSKLMLGDLALRATEAVSGEGTRQSDSKYFHVYQNGACYEFGLNVTTVAPDGVMKHVNRDRVFDRLEKILATVKINPVSAPEQTAEAPAPTPAQ